MCDKNFILWCQKTIPLVFDNSMSYYECLCKLLKYVNSLTTDVKEIARLQEELQRYVDSYFSDLNVQQEINNKLDEMASDGTLAKIINEEIFNDLNNKIDENKINLPNFFFSAFFEENNPFKINFFSSLDCLNFNNIKIEEDLKGRDVSFQYNKLDKNFYICLNADDGKNNFRLIYSKDLINWETKYFNVGIDLSLNLWAPDLYIDDNGKFYVVMSVQYGEEQDISGATIPAFDQYISSSSDGLTFSNAYKLNLDSQNRNYIDGNILKLNDIYYLLVKNEFSKINEIFSSKDLLNFTKVNENITNSSCWLEGGQLIEAEDKIYYIADAYMNDFYIVGFTYKEEFPNFNNNFNIIYSLKNYRHGSSIYIKDFESKKVISDLNSFNFSDNNKFFREASLNYNQSISLINDNNKNNLTIFPNVIYAITGSGTQEIKIKNIFNLNYMNFMFLSSNNTNLKITQIDDKILNIPISVVNNSNINEKVLKIEIDKSDYELYTPFKKESIDKSSITNLNEDFELSSLSAIKIENTVQLNFSLKSLTDKYVSGLWVDNIFTLPSKWKNENIALLVNDKNLNIQLINGSISGQIKLNQNQTVYCSITYIANF